MNELLEFYKVMAENENDNDNEDEIESIDIRKKRSTDDMSQDDPGNNGLSYLKGNEQEMKFQMQNIEEFLDKSRGRQKCGPTIEKSFEELKKIHSKVYGVYDH